MPAGLTPEAHLVALTSPGWRDHPMAAPPTDSAGYHPTGGPNGLPSAYKQYVTTFLYSFKPYLSTTQLLDHLLSILRSISASQPPPPESPASQLERHTCFVLQAGTHRAAGWARRVAGWGTYGCRLGLQAGHTWVAGWAPRVAGWARRVAGHAAWAHGCCSLGTHRSAARPARLIRHGEGGVDVCVADRRGLALIEQPAALQVAVLEVHREAHAGRAVPGLVVGAARVSGDQRVGRVEVLA